MARPKTLLRMAGADMTPSRLANSVVLLIDCQMEYVNGALPLAGVKEALKEVGALLERARKVGAPIIHVVHKGHKGGMFDPAGSGKLAAKAAARQGETVITKSLPNAFAGTGLDTEIKITGRKELIVAGFQTHMCVGATVRSALDHGYRCTVVAEATATRDLPDASEGGVVDAAILQRASLAALADRFAVIVNKADDLED